MSDRRRETGDERAERMREAERWKRDVLPGLVSGEGAREPTDDEVARVGAAIVRENPCRGWIRPSDEALDRVARAAIRALRGPTK